MVLTIVSRRGETAEMWCCACALDRRRCLSRTTSSDSSTSCGRWKATPVRAPNALWLEETGDVLGRPFFVMERVAGEVYEMHAPDGPDATPERIRRMCMSMAEQLAAIHRVDLAATGLDELSDGALISTASWTTGKARCTACNAGRCLRSSAWSRA